MKIRVIWLAIWTILLMSGCNHSENESTNKVQAILDSNIMLWKDSGILSYRYEYRKLCFCPPQENVVVIIEEGLVSEAFYTPSGVFLTEAELERLFTMEGLFEVIQNAITSNVASLNVTYNVDYGYPERISIDVDEAIADEEVTHLVTEFQ
ncbi:MAG: DUF6174 domain-containing protein [Candidatus Scalindua sp.]